MMTCPKCHNQMQSFTRSGLTVEQCAGCRGVFLDFGELEQIIRAEGAYWQQQMAQQQPMAAPPVNPLAARPPAAGSHGVVFHSSGHHPHHRHGQHRRSSFLGELFDV